jgi:hypothetical protein
MAAASDSVTMNITGSWGGGAAGKNGGGSGVALPQLCWAPWWVGPEGYRFVTDIDVAKFFDRVVIVAKLRAKNAARMSISSKFSPSLQR